MHLSSVRAGGATALVSAEALVIGCAAAQVILYLWIVVHVIGYPYPLEWVEAGVLDAIARAREGLPLYTQPSVQYVPYNYTPLFVWTGAAISRVTGLDFAGVRMVSLGAVAGIAILIWSFIRREGGSRVAAWAGVGLFAGTFHHASRSFHNARVDTLFVFFLISGLYVLRFGRGTAAGVIAGLILWLSFMTKQSALFSAALALPILAIGSWRKASMAACTFLALVLVTNAVADAHTGGWWSYFVYGQPARSRLVFRWWWQFWRDDMRSTMPIALVVGAAGVLLRLRQDRQGGTFYGALLISLLGTSWAGRAHVGGSGNALIPIFAGLAILMPLAVEIAPPLGRVRLAGLSALVLQLVMLLAAPSPAIPTAADRAAGDRFVEFLRGIDGEVLVWNLPFIETRAGKKSWGLAGAAEEVLRSPDVATKEAFKADVIAAARQGRFAGVIDPPAWLQQAVPMGPPVRLFPDDTVFVPVAGGFRPQLFFSVKKLQRRN